MFLRIRSPKLIDRLALQKADNDSPEVHNKLDGYDGPQKPLRPFAWRNQLQQQDGIRDATKARRHDGEKLAEVDIFDREFDLFGIEVLNVST
jgi:hypothetical protein